MASTEPQPPQSLQHLRTLLHDTQGAPAEAVAGLAAARTEVAGRGPIAHELLSAELRWLAAQPEAARPELAPAVTAARVAWRALRVRNLLAATDPDPAVLFDLAEARAHALADGDAASARDCEAGIASRLPGTAADPRLPQEAAERLAALLTGVEEASLRHQVLQLRCTGELLLACAVRTDSALMRRQGRRLLRAAGDRELARRLEGAVGRRGVALLETANFVLLLVVLVSIVVEATVDLPPGWLVALRWLDAGACLFFVADFVFELVLHPQRWSWFVRNALTDLLPAIPSVLFLLPGPGIPLLEDAVVLRTVRLLRVTWAARYVQALRPLLRLLRLLLFLVRGLDGLAQRFTQLLNREFVFVPAAADVRRPVAEEDRRDVLFAALRREHELAALLPAAERTGLLTARLQAAAAAMETLGDGGPRRLGLVSERDLPIGQAIEFLWALRPQDIGRWLRPGDVQALDRVVRVLSVLPVRWLPIVCRFVVHPLPATPEERIVQLGRRVADWLESWHGRLLFFADLHGIVTGPQILDRVASAMVKASQRPAVRLLLFGGLFLLFDLLVQSRTVSDVLGKIVEPLIVLGSVCLVVLSLGRWLKSLAGEAAEAYRLTSEAHFISQLERIKPRYERQDLAFLAARVFGPPRQRHAERLLRAQVASARTGVPVADAEAGELLCQEANRTALLYLHFLDGAPLHESDVKTTEQLLANHAIENLRTHFQCLGKRARKQLRKLKLDDGTVFAGPFLWFRFITESISVETAKRIAGYNRYCVPLRERAAASPEQLAAMQSWLQRRLDPRAGRALGERGGPAAGEAMAWPTTEFTALDFVGADPERDRHLAALFGDDVLQVVQQDRRTMVREIFGTRPVHNLPKHERSFNPLRFYNRRLSRGRVLAAPLLLLWRVLRSVVWLVGRIRQIVREVFDPELAMQRRELGTAPFAVALRKIHRMKAPGLLEAVRMRLELDPVYAGAPPGWSAHEPFATDPELERDLRFLHLREREAAGLRDAAAQARRRVEELHAAVRWLPPFAAAGVDADVRAAGELAVTSAWLVDKDHARTLLFAERWRTEVLPVWLADGVPGSRLVDLGGWLLGFFTVHPVDRWLQQHGRDLPRSARRPLVHAFRADRDGVRKLLLAWSTLPAGASPADTAIARLRAVWRLGPAVQRDLLALRAVQSLAVLDIRNYRDLVFQLGGYADDGEDPALGSALP
jgi:hypothetical protein